MDIDINQDCQFMSVLQSLETSGYINMLEIYLTFKHIFKFLGPFFPRLPGMPGHLYLQVKDVLDLMRKEWKR